jgi:hypothetical protein
MFSFFIICYLSLFGLQQTVLINQVDLGVTQILYILAELTRLDLADHLVRIVERVSLSKKDEK